MLVRRWMSLGVLALLLAPDGGEAAPGAGGGAGAPAGTPPATPPPATPPPATPPPAAAAAPDLEKLWAEARAQARAEALKDMGFADEAAFDKAQKAKKEEERARLSEAERQRLALDEAAAEKAKAQAKAEEAANETKALKAQIALRDLCDKHKVDPTVRRMVDVELAAARAEAKESGKPFEEQAFFDDLRKRHSTFFVASPAAPGGQPGAGLPGVAPPMFATLSPAAPVPALVGALPGGATVDASKMSPTEWAQYKARMGLS